MRILDEFDVYQDDNWRNTSIKTLLHDAEQPMAKGGFTQFILLTPLELPAHIIGGYRSIVTVHKVRPRAELDGNDVITPALPTNPPPPPIPTPVPPDG